MKTIVFAASKGGVGKTTLCAALSSFASSASKKKIAIIDLDPQGSLVGWWNQREAESPELIEASAGNLTEVLKKAEAASYDYVFIDTPPGHMKTIESGIANADYVLVPCQPSPVDIAAIGDTLSAIDELGKPFAFVMNRVIARTRIGEQAILLLANHGKVAGVPIAQRTAFATAMTDGRSAPEVQGGKQAEEEISTLWKFVLSNLKK
ncbi:MAG: AAA family ATPase [Cognatishimia sp.]